MKVSEICKYAPKSNIKARDACDGGKYVFFTSSADESKRYNAYQHEGEGIIMGTGGNATLHYYDGKYAVSTDCIVLLPNEQIRCKYLYYFFLGNMRVLERGFKGAGLKHTNKGYIGDIDIGDIPSFERQEKIIGIFDTLQSIIDLRKSEIERLDNLIKARFVELFGDPRDNSMGFEKQKLKDSCIVVTGNTPSRAIAEYYGDYVEWIKTDNIVTGLINPTRAKECLSEKGMEVGRIVQKDSILMTCIAGSIASIGRVCITDRTVAFNQQINAIIPDRYNVLFLYVLLQISKNYLAEDVNMALKGILSKSKLEEKQLIVPPIELQNQFADFVRQVDKSKFPNIEEIKSVSYIYEKKSNDREIGLEWIHFEGIINIGKNFSEKIAREYDWEPCDTIPNLSIKTKNTDYMYCEEFTDDYTSDSFVGEFYFVPSSKQLIFYGEY